MCVGVMRLYVTSSCAWAECWGEWVSECVCVCVGGGSKFFVSFFGNQPVCVKENRFLCVGTTMLEGKGSSYILTIIFSRRSIVT